MSGGTGRTSAQLRDAIARADEGEAVVYVTRGPIEYYFHLAVHLLESRYRLDQTRQRVVAPSGGSVEFVAEHNLVRDAARFKGRRVIIHIDHAAALDATGWALLRRIAAYRQCDHDSHAHPS